MTKTEPEPFTRPTIDSLIEQTLAVTEADQPADIAEEVIRRIKSTDFRIYLKQLISGRIPSVAGRVREKANPIRAGRSTKQQLIRDQYWPQFLQTMVALPSGYKRMAELTADDLDTLAAFRRSQANELAAKAKQFEQLAWLMREARVKVLEQLPSDQGEKALAA